MQPLKENVTRLEGDSAVSGNDVDRTQCFEFENQGWFGLFWTGCDQLHSRSISCRMDVRIRGPLLYSGCCAPQLRQISSIASIAAQMFRVARNSTTRRVPPTHVL